MLAAADRNRSTPRMLGLMWVSGAALGLAIGFMLAAPFGAAGPIGAVFAGGFVWMFASVEQWYAIRRYSTWTLSLVSLPVFFALNCAAWATIVLPGWAITLVMKAWPAPFPSIEGLARATVLGFGAFALAMLCALGLVFVMSAMLINLLEGLVLPAGEWDARAWGMDLWKGGAAATVVVWCAQLSAESWLVLPASTGGAEASVGGATVAVAAVIGSVGAGSIWGQGAETRLPGWKWRGGKHDLYLWAVLAQAGGFLAWAAATTALVVLGTSPLGYLAMAVIARLVLETRNGLALARLAADRQTSPLTRPEPALDRAESTANPSERDVP